MSSVSDTLPTLSSSDEPDKRPTGTPRVGPILSCILIKTSSSVLLPSLAASEAPITIDVFLV